MTRRRTCITSFAMISIILLAASSALAQQDVTNNRLDSIVDVFRTQSGAWLGALQAYAARLFWALALIEFCWTGCGLAFRGSDFSEWVAELVNRILFIGFFWTLLLHSSEWAGAVVNSFREAANGATRAAGGTPGITPSNVFDTALEISNKLLAKTSYLHPGDSTGMVVGALVIVVCFGLLSASLILALVESYIVISAGVIFMGFGGSRWTKDYAIRTATYALSVGAKLFVIQLLIGLGETMIRSWLQTLGTTSTDMMVMIGCSIVMLALVKSVPDIVQGLINGSSVGHGAALMGAASSVAGAATAVAAAVTGGGAAVAASYKLAREQLSAKLMSSSDKGWTGALASQTLGNLASAAKADIGHRLSGRAHHGHMSWRMTESMAERAAQVRAAQEQGTPPGQQAQAEARPQQNVIKPAS